MKLLTTDIKNAVLNSMEKLLQTHKSDLLEANKKDLDAFIKEDQALYDRLVMNDKKVEQMAQAVKEVRLQEDPVNKELSMQNLDNGLQIINKTAPFGTIMIIYESRPDVTVEAAVLAFKANNKILLKGGKEAYHSNKALVKLWHQALKENGLPKDYIQFLEMDRTQTQAFLKNPDQPLDLIVPRGGERLIAFVKEHAKCAVLVSGRGNNFMYVHPEADWEMTKKVLLNAKTHKISACNALDKILLDVTIPDFEAKVKELAQLLKEYKVNLIVDKHIHSILPNELKIDNEDIWKEEFLAMKCVLGAVSNQEEAMEKINLHSGGHSAAIMTADNQAAQQFMDGVDCAAVYQNASTRFTDGGQMGVGAELAISTDKLHHRGPLGLKQLVTNKYYVFGNGQIRV
ncbi:glutamate-5-semialdehyde dehydrogenase [Flavobacterium sp. ASW18X]|uniref:glutamate-5-semialdehyde dehydrogenase n=1 Tax=Flavobacterium sp. ASW18X TaxID=2572595 RepID=UPI0010ADE1BF|nr:glutamate-5-semialdehyde dehydrogenase [Flavobacterium sp. ASW18X]TKD60664.1 glutamate-5-semialdehyde dehydrogenase [Flavobacterium sp. ASW18X]